MKTKSSAKIPALAVMIAGSCIQPHFAFAGGYADYIASTNPVGWWGMNETSGTTTADLSGANGAVNNQTAGGSPVYPGGSLDPLGPRNLDMTYGSTALLDQAGFVSGAGNHSTYFDGTVNSVAYAHATGPVNSATPGAIYHYDSQTGGLGLSIEVWAKTDGTTGADSDRFITNRLWGFGFTDGGGFGALHFTTFGVKDYFGGAMPSDNQWHQIGVSWSATTGTADFYVDGLPRGSAAGPANLFTINPSSIANQVDLGAGRVFGSQYFKGYLDEVVLWNIPRTAADFAASYAAAVTPPLTYQTWIASFSPAPNPSATADDDKDGIPNSVEFVLGTSPIVPNTSVLPVALLDGGDLKVSFERWVDSKKCPGTTIFMDVSTDLANWAHFQLGVDSDITVADPVNGYEHVTLTVARGSDPIKFARLRVVVAP